MMFNVTDISLPLWALVTAEQALTLALSDGPPQLPLFTTYEAARAFREQSGQTHAALLGLQNSAALLELLNHIPDVGRVLIDADAADITRGEAVTITALAAHFRTLD
jgi:hypothetical protein